ncbi:MarR family winged helix-turn-helix transcriptional regulator [Exiguobacterium oxidotolerans]|uniref:Putative transcriptional regulator (MarR family) n=1 Tax=Exiguobacterium oxidotolerans TaxID=223958 RepID=A0A653I469_9BACL|nr:MarR family transcriptional regulator [Exiguobacterium oxidotolerans]VWX33784.1 putative transcriptional regulator (MarR family) [Exiguobacterium oxidotolerans]
MKDNLREAVVLFEEVMIHGTERVLKSVESPVWRLYSPEQLHLLKIVGKYGPIASGRIAVMQGVHKSAISNRLKKLNEKGLVEVERAEDDHRTKQIILTQAGHDVVEESNQAIYLYLEQLIDGKVEDDEIQQFIETFKKVKSILKIED